MTFNHPLNDLLEQFGYPEITPGPCFGFSCMAMQAFMANDFSSFNKRLKSIIKISDSTIKKWRRGEPLTLKKKLQINDFHAFLDGLQLYQAPNNYPKILKNMFQNMGAQALVTPINLDIPGQHIVVLNNTYGIYTKISLYTYFQQLQQHLTFRTSMILFSSNHAMNLNYDPKEKTWLFVNSNDTPWDCGCDYEPTSNIDGLIKQIFWGFNGILDHEFVVFNTRFFSKAANMIQARQNILQLEQHPEWKQIHEITPTNVNNYDFDGGGLLFLAALTGNPELLDRLIKLGADPIKKTKLNNDPLLVAIESGNHQNVASLLNHLHLNENVSDTLIQAAIHACHFGNQAIIEQLQLKGFNPANKIAFMIGDGLLMYSTCLMIAAASGQKELVHYFVTHYHFLIHQTTELGETALHHAVARGDIEIISYLLKHGSLLHQRTKEGLTELHIAAKYGHKEVIEYLLEQNVSLEQQSEDGRTALHFAAKSGDVETVAYLIRKGCKLDHRTNHNQTVLHYAIEHAIQSRELLLLQYLLDKGALIHHSTNFHQILDFVMRPKFKENQYYNFWIEVIDILLIYMMNNTSEKIQYVNYIIEDRVIELVRTQRLAPEIAMKRFSNERVIYCLFRLSASMELLKLADPYLVEHLVKKGEIKPEHAVLAFSDHPGILAAAYHINPFCEIFQSVDSGIIIQLVLQNKIHLEMFGQTFGHHFEIISTVYQKIDDDKKPRLLRQVSDEVLAELMARDIISPTIEYTQETSKC